MKFFACTVFFAILAAQVYAEEDKVESGSAVEAENLVESADDTDNVRHKKSAYGAAPAYPQYGPPAMVPMYSGYAPSRPSGSAQAFAAPAFSAPKPAPVPVHSGGFAAPKPAPGSGFSGGFTAPKPASAPVFMGPRPAAPRPSGAVYAGPAVSYSYPSPAPVVPCGKNLLFSCAPAVAPVPCRAPAPYYAPPAAY